MKKQIGQLALATLLAFAGLTTPTLTVAQTAAAPAQSNTVASKKEHIATILAIQQPAIENIARVLAQEPAEQMMQQAGVLLQTRVPPEKREALGKEIQNDLKKYAEDAVPLVRERALKIAPSTIGTFLDEKFSDEELKQLIAILESPVNRKFQQLSGDMQKVLVEKLVADTRSQIDPKVRALDLTIGKRLGIQPTQAQGQQGKAVPAAATGVSPAAKAASK